MPPRGARPALRPRKALPRTWGHLAPSLSLCLPPSLSLSFSLPVLGYVFTSHPSLLGWREATCARFLPRNWREDWVPEVRTTTVKMRVGGGERGAHTHMPGFLERSPQSCPYAGVIFNHSPYLADFTGCTFGTNLILEITDRQKRTAFYPEEKSLWKLDLH